MLRVLSALVCVLLCLPLWSADPCDPWASSSPRVQFSNLAALREALDKAPNDQHLMGLALACYDMLLLPSSRRMHPEDQGNWLTSAQLLRDRRQAARAGKPAISFDEDLPELLLLICEHRSAEALAALERWAVPADDSRAQALRAFITRDWRPLMGRDSYAPLVAKALTWARSNAWLDAGPEKSVLPQRERQLLDWDMIHLRRHLVSETAFMLNSRSIPDADAIAALNDIITIIRPNLRLEPTRQILTDAIARWSGEHDHDDAEVRATAVAYRICEQYASSPQGLMDGPRYRLLGLGDVAAWNRAWLHLALVDTADHVGADTYDVGYMRGFGRACASILPDTLIAAETGLQFGGITEPQIRFDLPTTPKADLDRLVNAIESEWSRPHGMSDGAILEAITILAPRRHPQVPRLLATAVQRILVSGSPALVHRAALCLGRCYAFVDEMPESYRDLLETALRNDPWNWALRERRQVITPGHPRLAPDAKWKPDATWIDPTLDHGATPWPACPSVGGQCFLARWRGWLRIPADGTYRFTLTADDGARLEVGPVALDAWSEGGHRRSGAGTFTAGWHALDVGYFQGWGRAQIRLAWQPPGAKKPVAIPADALAHGDDRRPGLVGECWWHTTEFIFRPLPTGEELDWLRQRPWMSRAWTNAGAAFAVNRRFATALPWMDTAGSPTPYGMVLRDITILNAAPERTDEVIRHLAASGRMRWNWSNYGDNTVALAEGIIAQGATRRMLDAITSASWREKPDQHQLFFMSMLSLAAGDFPTALRQREALLASNHDYALFWWSDDLLCRLEVLALKRLTNQPEPDLDEIEDALKRLGLTHTPDVNRAWRYLSGAITATTAANEMRAPDDARTTWYFIGLQHLAEGRWDDARAALITAAEAGDNGWRTVVPARALVDWIDHQTPEQRAAWPRGRAIPLRTIKPDENGNRF